jgi:hypothetical protein
VIGEVRTALLQHSRSVPLEVARRVLELRTDEPVRLWERPISFAVSPNIPTGVDCRIATQSGRKVRGIGTVATRVAIIGCRVLQGSSYAELTLAESDRRAPWSHYLSRPGRIELTAGKVDWDDVRAGFLSEDSADALNLGAVSEHTMDDVQMRRGLDRKPPFRARRTALRWFLEEPSDDDQFAHFTVTDPVLRTLHLAVAGSDLADLVRLCEDLALHDWLLTTVVELVERSQRATDQPILTIEGLRLAIEHLTHLWLPGAHVAEPLRGLWDGFDKKPGFSRQWDVTVNRIRDLVAVTTAGLLAGRGDAAIGAAVTEPALQA